MSLTDAPPTRSAVASDLELIDAYWRAANYLSVGQIYLLDNPLLREPLRAEHVKPRLLGHWGTTPGLNLLYAHMNRVIRQRDLNALYVTGPGHGGPGLVANAYLEGTYSEVYPSISRDEDGMRALFRQFSFPGGIPSHVAPETPGSIHEGGELGYALVHAYGAAFDNPDLLVLCVVGDGEAETGPLAASWHSNKFLNPVTDGAVLPVLHLNGYKIANPTRAGPHPRGRARRADARLRLRAALRRWRRRSGDDPATVHAAARGHARRRCSTTSPRSSRRPAAAVAAEPDAPGLADDRPAHPEGLDRAEGGRRPPGRGHLPRPPGPAGRDPRQRRAPRAARAVDAQLPARGAVRRHRAPGPGAAGARPAGRPADEREPARQRRPAAARPA